MTSEPASPQVSVILPALNESMRISAVLQGLAAVLVDKPHEILVIDDGSSDDTGEIATKLGARVIRQAYRKGNGAAIKRGIREAKGEIIVLMDADGQHKPEDLPRLLEALNTCDMAVGARTKGSGQKAHRWAANRLFSAMASYLASERIPDLTSGFRAIKASLAKRYVDLLPNTFSYPSTLTITLARSGYTVVHVPIVAAQRAQGSKSKIRPLSDGLLFLIILIKVGVGLAPFRIFFPVSILIGMLGLGWYAYTFINYNRFTNMSMLLLCTAIIIFMMGLVADQIAQLRRERRDD